MTQIGWYLLAALCEIGGCFGFWAWLRLGKSAWFALPGTFFLVAFALALTRAGGAFAGRTYAAYGGMYVMASLLWLWAVEGALPDRWDIAGGAICLLGTAIILFGHRAL